jgi:hypothetical protein
MPFLQAYIDASVVKSPRFWELRCGRIFYCLQTFASIHQERHTKSEVTYILLITELPSSTVYLNMQKKRAYNDRRLFHQMSSSSWAKL